MDDTNQGLSQIEAERLLQAEGFNELPSQKSRSALVMLFAVLSEPMLLLLVGCGAIYVFMGEMKDALMLLSFVFVVIGITFYQERKTERTLEALRDLSSPRALVIRDGEPRRIPGREVARGDICIMEEGDRVPADATVLSTENLSVDESLLTGESMPVRKAAWDGKQESARPGGDDLPFLYSGTMVVGGRGVAKATATGTRTEIGKIGASLEAIKDEDTLLHKETKTIVRRVAIGAVFLCLLVVILYVVIKGSLIQGFLAGLTLSMAMLPEEFPVVLLIFLTMGAWRISKRKVLTRRSAAIETLGAATVLCTDKTGTLTLNKMQLASAYAEGTFYEFGTGRSPLPGAFRELLEYGVLSSRKDPFDPIEKELNALWNKHEGEKVPGAGWTLAKEYSLSKKLLAVTHVWTRPDEKGFVIASKGAPEAILSLCEGSADEKAAILGKVREMSDTGLRVLAAAKGTFRGAELPDSPRDFRLSFIGLFGFVDPARESAPGAVREAHEAGMRVIMITGDYPGTAQFVARKIGLRNPDSFLTGDDIERMSPPELAEKIRTIDVFARVVPEQKLAIVEALKANGEIVAMTGDGVNDAPALKAAHIGIAMGERGTDVAREASALVLLNDDFSSIVAAVRLGRRIYDNLKRAMGYILSVHVPIAGMFVLPLVFDFPAVLLPAHIAFLELVIDPACSAVFESKKENPDIMKRPPRDLNEPMFSGRTVGISMLQGLGVLVAAFLLFVYALHSGMGETEARSFAFAALVLGNLSLIAVNLSWSKSALSALASANATLIALFAGTLLCLGAVLYVPFFSGLFHLTALSAYDLILVAAAVALSIMWFEVMKLFTKGLKYA